MKARRSLLVFLSALTVAACGGTSSAGHSSPSPNTHTLTGVFHRADTRNMMPGVDSPEPPCTETGDMQQGAPVTVTDGAGHTLGTGQLQGGSPNGNFCDFAFSVVVIDGPYYSIGMPGMAGTRAFSRQQLDSAGWSVSLP